MVEVSSGGSRRPITIREIKDLVEGFQHGWWSPTPVTFQREDLEIVQRGKRLMSFSVCNTLLYLFNQPVVASALLFVKKK